MIGPSPFLWFFMAIWQQVIDLIALSGMVSFGMSLILRIFQGWMVALSHWPV